MIAMGTRRSGKIWIHFEDRQTEFADGLDVGYQKLEESIMTLKDDGEDFRMSRFEGKIRHSL